MLGRFGLHGGDEPSSHRVDAVAHLREFFLPRRPQVGICQHGGHDGGTVLRRIRVVHSHTDFGVTVRRLSRFLGTRHKRHRSDSLAVHAEILGERTADQGFHARSTQLSHTRRILVHTSIADELVGKLVQAYRQVRIGDPIQDGTLMGPLVEEDAVSTMMAALERARVVSDVLGLRTELEQAIEWIADLQRAAA